MVPDSRHPREIRAGRLIGVTAGLGRGFFQCILVELPRAQAYDFLLFCQRNPKVCPQVEVYDVGAFEPSGPSTAGKYAIPGHRMSDRHHTKPVRNPHQCSISDSPWLI